jgi:hypothetical protein
VLNKTLVATCDPLFTAQPEAPAFVLAGASGWAVNEKKSSPDSFDTGRLAPFRLK